MFEYLTQAFTALLHWDLLLLCFGGASLGMIFGAIPGISGGMGMVLLLPLTLSMEPTYAMAMLCSIHIGGISGGYIGSILLGIPGESASVATVYDGYQFTRQGDPVRALSVATVANFTGSIPGIIIALLLCQWIAKYAVKLGPWEMFALSMTGITMVVSLSENNMLKGLLGAGLGLLVTCIGLAPVSATPRFNFGLYQLAGGFERANVILGVYAGRTIFLEYVRGERLGDAGTNIKVSFFKWHKGDFSNNIGTIIRSFGLGAWIGFLPGLGSSLANVVSYAAAKKAAKDPDSFGKGNIAGVWAPEVANNACIGGELIPTIALGIPGSGHMVYLLMGLIMTGVDPGPLLFHAHPDVVYMIFCSSILGAIGLLLFQLIGMPLFPLLLRAPYQYLYPAIVMLIFVGAYTVVGSISSALILIVFTLLGVGFSYAGIPHVPFVLAFILGEIIETNFRNGISMSPQYGWMSFFVRPVSCFFLVLLVFLLFYPRLKKAFLARHANIKAVVDQVEEDEG